MSLFARSRHIREINYKGLNSDHEFRRSRPLQEGEGSAFQWRASTTPPRSSRPKPSSSSLLAEHGHQFATIKTDVKTIPPASVQVNFNIKEGPVVKVGKITFVGNQHLSALFCAASMKNLKPIGIPYSIIFEDLFPQTYDSSKLEEDTERVRQAYRDKGYANAAVEQPKTQIRDEGGLNWFTFRPQQRQAHRYRR